MYPANITRAEASARSELLSTHSYRLAVDLTGRDYPDQAIRPDEQFVTTSVISFSSRAGVTFVDCIADAILEAELDQRPVDLAHFDGTRVGLDLSEGDHELRVVAIHRYSHSGEGLHRFVDPADDRVYLYTQFESAHARRVYANFEQPDLKARFTWSVTAPSNWLVAANGVQEAVHSGDGFSTWTFAETRPLSTYLTALVAGEYAEVKRTVRSASEELPASLICRQSLVDHLDADRIMATTQGGFEVFEDIFGVAYPFGKYDQAFVPEYNMGAMENAGLVTFRDEYLFRSRATAAQYESRDNTILHELCHMWFGDLVTMRWWDDLWLKESFAEWGSHFAQSRLDADPEHAWTAFANARKTWAYRADQLPSTHPIAADMVDLEAVELNYDGITYAKGASVLRQLVAFVGEDAFIAGAKAYFAKHAYGNTTLADLLAALAEASGRDLSGWAQEWLESTGVNTLRAEVAVDEQNRITELTIRQSGTLLRHHRIAIGCFDRVGDSLQRTAQVEVDIADAATAVPELVGSTRPDLLLVNDSDLTFAKIRLDPQSRETMVTGTGAVDSELSRALLWSAAWDMTRDGELPVPAYLAMIEGAIASETDITAVSRVLGQSLTAIQRYAAPAQRAELLQRRTALTARLLKGAEPGSDHQLAFARALIAGLSDDPSAELIKGWLAGEEVPAGLSVDTDLRWAMITSLASAGAIGTAEIDAEAQRDRTITGAEWAAGARSALPGEQTKAAAWELATATAQIPNETHRSVCGNFYQPGQQQVLAAYEAPYFALVEQISAQEGIWAKQSTSMGQTAISSLFPRYQEDAAYLQRLDDWLAGAEINESARRIVLEGRDDALRALHAQQQNEQAATTSEGARG